VYVEKEETEVRRRSVGGSVGGQPGRGGMPSDDGEKKLQREESGTGREFKEVV
jgi:hypothetical protein